MKFSQIWSHCISLYGMRGGRKTNCVDYCHQKKVSIAPKSTNDWCQLGQDLAYHNMLFWNKALWLDGPSHVSSFNQSECFISIKLWNATLKLVHDIDSRRPLVLEANHDNNSRYYEQWYQSSAKSRQRFAWLTLTSTHPQTIRYLAL